MGGDRDRVSDVRPDADKDRLRIEEAREALTSLIAVYGPPVRDVKGRTTPREITEALGIPPERLGFVR
jgi:hypothetical protein